MHIVLEYNYVSLPDRFVTTVRTEFDPELRSPRETPFSDYCTLEWVEKREKSPAQVKPYTFYSTAGFYDIGPVQSHAPLY